MSTKVKFSDLIAQDQLTVVDFGAKWCGPCRMVAPKFEALKEKYPSATLISIDVDEATGLSDKYEISSVPTFILFKNGKICERMTGTEIEELESLIKEYQ